MLRLSRRAWAAIGAVALGMAIACGETLPSGGDGSDGSDAATDGGEDASSEVGTDGGVDAAGDENADADATLNGEPCTPDLPYGDPVLLDYFENLGAVASVRPHHGGAPVAFASRDLGSGGFFDIVEVDFPMMASTPAYSMRSGPNDELHPAPLAGNMKVYYDEPIDAGVVRIFSASRTQAGQKLENPQPETIPIGTATSVMQPWSVDGTNSLYVAVQLSTVRTDIWRVEKVSGNWTTSEQLGGALHKTHPVVSNDERIMFFARNDSGTRRVHVATRTGPTATWSGAIEMQGKVNEVGADTEPSWLSPDRCTLIVTSNRGGLRRAYKIAFEHR
jgi:hypothetical protein